MLYELQFDEFSDEAILRFWQKVSNLKNKKIVLEIDTETANLVALSSSINACGFFGVKLNAYETMKKWDCLANDPHVSDAAYDEQINQEVGLIVKKLEVLKPNQVEVLIIKRH